MTWSYKQWADRLFRRGLEAYTQNNQARILTLWVRALTWYERAGDKSSTARCLNSLGNIHQLSGQSAQALVYYERAYALHEQIGDYHGQAADLGNLGVVYQTLGGLDKAREYA